MVKKKEDVPEWVSNEIWKTCFYDKIRLWFRNLRRRWKIDVQLYEPGKDGRHIVTMDLPKKIKSADLKKRAVCEFTFDSLKASLSKKNCRILEEKEIEKNVIYQFELKNLELLDIGSTESADVKVE